MKTAQEMLERMEALVRRMAAEDVPFSAYKEAREILAEMTPDVDPDLIEAREICALTIINGAGRYEGAENCRAGKWDESPQVIRALAAIKRGPQA